MTHHVTLSVAEGLKRRGRRLDVPNSEEVGVGTGVLDCPKNGRADPSPTKDQ